MGRRITFTGVNVTVFTESSQGHATDEIGAAIANLAPGMFFRVGGWEGERWEIESADFTPADATIDDDAEYGVQREPVPGNAPAGGVSTEA